MYFFSWFPDWIINLHGLGEYQARGKVSMLICNNNHGDATDTGGVAL